MNDIPKRWVLAALILVPAFTPIARPVEAAESPAYARFCTWAAARSNQASAGDVTQATRVTAARDAADETIARAVQRQLQLAAVPRVIVRDVQHMVLAFDPADTTHELVLLSDMDERQPHWWLATRRPDGAIERVIIADKAVIAQSVGFARGIAAYALVNDLLGGDALFPRDGCRAYVTSQFFEFPAVQERIIEALRTAPPANEKVEQLVRAAWSSAARNPPSESVAEIRDITDSTFKAVGDDPPVTVVYRDPGLPGDGIGELDVVRIGGAAHTYAIVSNDGTRPAFRGPKDAPLCVVGDVRCARYYVWP